MLRKNNSGFGLVHVFIFSTVIIILVSTLTQIFPLITKNRVKQKDRVQHDVLLKGTLDFIVNAINDKWCINLSSFVRKDCSTDLKAWVNDAGSWERLILSLDSVSNSTSGINARLNALMPTSTPTPTPLPSNNYDAILGLKTPYTTFIDKNNLTSNHPLAILLDVLKSTAEYSGVKITISRKLNLNLPSSGSEVVLDIKCELTGNTVASIFNKPAFTSGTFLFSPVSLHRYALYIGGDLRLDSTSTTANRADIAIPAFSSESAANNSKGNLFGSDIYIDGDLILPDLSANGGVGVYNDTTFGGNIHIAGKLKRRETSSSSPISLSDAMPSSSLTYESVTKGQIRGILGSVRHREENDSGVRVLFDLAAGLPPDTTLAKNCINRSKQFDLKETKNAQLLVKKESETILSNEKKASYLLAFSDGAQFNAQSEMQPAVKIDENSQNLILDANLTGNENDFPLIKGTLVASNGISPSSKIAFQMGHEMSLVLTMPVATPTVTPTATPSITPTATPTTSPNTVAVVTLKTSPVLIGGYKQKTKTRLEVSVTSPEALNWVPEITIHGYENGDDGKGNSVRTAQAQTLLKSNIVILKFSKNQAGELVLPNVPQVYSLVTNSNPQEMGASISNEDDTKIDRDCDGDGSVAFSAASPFQDFTPVTKHSWNFNPPDPATAVLSFKFSNAHRGIVDPNYRWPVHSIVDKVIIYRDAEIVAADIVTKKLEIQGGRSKPLIIIGTWIVKNLDMPQDVVASGITWYNKFHPNALKILTDTRRLGTVLKAGAKCSDLYDGKLPIWHLAPSAADLNTIVTCNVNSLLTADPFNWTKVKPQCGLISSATSPYTSCNYRYEISEVWEIQRKSSSD